MNETLSIFAWAAAAFATLYFAPHIAPFLRERMSPPLVGTIVAYLGIFLVVLIPLSFISYRFSENVKNSPVGAVDRAFGLIFGIIRGLRHRGHRLSRLLDVRAGARLPALDTAMPVCCR